VCAALDALTLLTGFALMSLSAWGLVMHRQDARAQAAARRYLIWTLIAETLLIGGLALRVRQTEGELLLSTWQSTPADPLTLTLLLLSFGIKAGAWPLHHWLPWAHPAAPAPASALLSGLLIKTGIYGLWVTLSGAQEWLLVMYGLIAIGGVSFVIGIIHGLRAQHLKTVLAYSSISQMGLHLVWLGVLLPMQGFSAALWLGWVMLHHGCAKAALFLLAGEAQRSGWRRIMWVGWVPVFALIGLPWTSGGILKIELKAISQDQGLSWLFILISLSAIGTVWLMWHFWRLLRATVRPSQVQQQPTSSLPWLVLSLLGLIWPWLWIQQANLSISALDQWHLTWPILMAIAIGVGVLRRRS
jgi:formate hydrogenlyase subunit 3/multisubunit Na+/H+ antiporter MnhD subunit